ncbi:Hsp20 family protein [Yunchengibacter salinarum]|uniref:Hsp20 family protein n=1 Tax=Yunchengibacter salinarum TaxID=3133399 RepID=UPI0035B62E7E
MRHFDLTPLLRSSVGFDHLNRLLDSSFASDEAPGYPPYNIEKLSEDDYRITMAVAGFRPDELDVTVQDGTLVISGKAEETSEDEAPTYLHRGIAKRAFERRFQLAETVQVGEARFENGLLEVGLKRVIPDHKKPRQIAIQSGADEKAPKAIEADAA